MSNVGRIDFTEENKTAQGFDFPKLRLEKDEKKRIVCIENPLAEFVHNLRMPTIEHGKPVMETRKRANGTEYQDYKMDFIGAPLCLGDEEILLERGSDPKNCPACAAAAEGDLVKPPQRKFAMHVFVYNTKSNGDLLRPFGGQVMVWTFTGKRFDKLVDIQKEWGSLQKHDLVLGPCISKDFQSYDIAASPKAEWLLDEERQAYVKQMVEENQAPDLKAFCGRAQESKWMLDDIEKIRTRWKTVNGTSYDLGENDSGDLSEGLDDLLEDEGRARPPASDVMDKPGTGGVESFDDLLGTI